MRFPSQITGNAKSPGERFQARIQAADYFRVRGTERRPEPPRDIVVQSGPRGVFVTWKLPQVSNDITGWRVYKGDENTMYDEIRDRGTRQKFIESTAGTTPPNINIFVSSMNALGKESQKVQAKGAPLTETGAPSMPSTPPGYTNESSGGGDQSAFLGPQGIQLQFT